MSVASGRLGVWEGGEHELSELAGKTSRAGIISMMTKSTTGRNRPTCPSSTPNPQLPTCGLFSSEQHSLCVTTPTLIVGYFGSLMALVGPLCRHRGYFLPRSLTKQPASLAQCAFEIISFPMMRSTTAQQTPNLSNSTHARQMWTSVRAAGIHAQPHLWPNR